MNRRHISSHKMESALFDNFSLLLLLTMGILSSVGFPDPQKQTFQGLGAADLRGSGIVPLYRYSSIGETLDPTLCISQYRYYIVQFSKFFIKRN